VRLVKDEVNGFSRDETTKAASSSFLSLKGERSMAQKKVALEEGV
jgi:hypothetical protein